MSTNGVNGGGENDCDVDEDGVVDKIVEKGRMEWVWGVWRVVGDMAVVVHKRSSVKWLSVVL